METLINDNFDIIIIYRILKWDYNDPNFHLILLVSERYYFGINLDFFYEMTLKTLALPRIRNSFLFVCQVGELIGGSQREERLEYLEDRLDNLKLNKDSYWWYLDLRRYGSG